MVTWKFVFREMRRRPGRTILTLLSIVIGVAALVAVRLATNATSESYSQMFASVNGKAALQVVSATGTPISQSLVEQVKSTSGVRVATPVLRRGAVLYVGRKKSRVFVLGVDPASEFQVRENELISGKMFASADELVLDESFSRSLNVRVGDTVRLFSKRGQKEFEVVGLMRSRTAAAAAQGGSAWMSLAAAQQRFSAQRQVDAIDVVLQDNDSRDAVRDSLAQLLPQGVEAQLPSTHSHLAEETMLAAQHGLSMARAFSVVLAVFVIMNTFFMNVSERRRPMAIMRAIGATRSQIEWLLISESLLLGVVGAALGLLLGRLFAQLVGASFANMFQVELPHIQWESRALLYGAVFGPGMALLGAVVPARQAGKLSPLEGMSWSGPRGTIDESRWTLGFGLFVLVLSSILLTGSIGGWLPVDLSVLGAVFVLIGIVFVMPVALRPLTYLASLITRQFWRIETRLARREVLRNRWRTALTIGVLFVATSTGIGLGSSVLDNIRDVRQWYRRLIVGDYFVRALAPDMATGLAADMPDEVGQLIKNVPNTSSILALRIVSMRVADFPALVVVRDFFVPDDLNFNIVGMDAEALLKRLSLGEVVIGSVLAKRTGLAVGDSVPVETENGSVQLKIAAVANDYFAGGLCLYMQREVGRKLMGIDGVDAYIIRAEPAARQKVQAELESICEAHGLLLQSYADISGMVEGMMTGIVASLWGLLALGFLVAAFGVINTLTMNVLEQTRQLGLLRVVAMTRRQIRRMVLIQAVMMGFVGLVPGLIAGEAVAYVINLSTLPVTGHPVEFVVRPMFLAGSLLLAMLIVLTASWAPAERAARIELSAALNYQ